MSKADAAQPEKGVSGDSEEERAPLAQQAYHRIRELIVANTFAAGEYVLEQELADRLAMSRTPVREALIRLVQEGLIEVRPRHGMRVLPISPRDMAEIYDIIAALETLAVEKAASAKQPARKIAALDKAVRDMERALSRDDLVAWAEADETFHRLIVEMAGSERLSAAVNIYWDQLHRARMVTLHLRPKPVSSNADHAAVIAAIKRGDAATAVKVHREHRTRSGKMLTELLHRLNLTAI